MKQLRKAKSALSSFIRRFGSEQAIGLQMASVFTSSVLLTLLFWQVLPRDWLVQGHSDFHSFYAPVARSLVAGRGFTLPDGELAVRYPPGYPLLLAGIFKLAETLSCREEMLLDAFSLVGTGLSCVLVFLIARTVWRSRSVGMAVLLWMTYPFALWLTVQSNSETAFMVVMLAGFHKLWSGLQQRTLSSMDCLVVGVLIGLSMLIRPIALGLGLVLAVTVLLLNRARPVLLRARLAGVLVVGGLLTIAPWQIWLHTQTEQFALLSTGGLDALRDGLTFAVKPKSYRQGIEVPEDVRLMMNDFWGRYPELHSVPSVIFAVAEEVRDRPVPMVRLLALKIGRSWYGRDSQQFEREIFFVQVPYLLLIACASLRAWKMGGSARNLAIAVWLVALYFWAMTVASSNLLRYMVPAVALLFCITPSLLATRRPERATKTAFAESISRV